MPIPPHYCNHWFRPIHNKDSWREPLGEEIDLGVHPDSGLPVVAKNGRFGPYVTEVLPDDGPKSARPRTGSLFKSMSLDTVTLEDAVKLLSLPRVVGEDRRDLGRDELFEPAWCASWK